MYQTKFHQLFKNFLYSFQQNSKFDRFFFFFFVSDFITPHRYISSPTELQTERNSKLAKITGQCLLKKSKHHSLKDCRLKNVLTETSAVKVSS